MKRYFFPVTILLIIALGASSQVRVQHLLCENRVNPIGLDITNPRFSWQLVSGKRNTIQTAYEITVNNAAGKNRQPIWSSGKIVSQQSVYIPYSGGTLQPNHTYYWQVRVWDNSGKTSSWSETALWQTGFFKESDWKAKWIESTDPSDSINAPALLFRKQFNAAKKIQSATAFITAHGMYEAKINGSRMGDSYLTPGWTSYKKRLQYQSYDVTSLLKQGENAIGVTLGSGWYRTPLAWDNNKNLYETR